jgi:hypothetical protein
MWGICLTGYCGLNTRIARCAGSCVDLAKKGVLAGRTQHWDAAGEWEWCQPNWEAEVSALAGMVAPRRWVGRRDRVQRQVSTGPWGSWAPPRPILPRERRDAGHIHPFWLIVGVGRALRVDAV